MTAKNTDSTDYILYEFIDDHPLPEYFMRDGRSFLWHSRARSRSGKGHNSSRCDCKLNCIYLFVFITDKKATLKSL